VPELKKLLLFGAIGFLLSVKRVYVATLTAPVRKPQIKTTRPHLSPKLYFFPFP
jgi:hypothetical protein